VEATLGDPRSWGNGGRMSFQRVGVAEAAADQYDFRVTLVSPGNMEKYCPGVGTGGYTSCRYGERAVINLARWETAVPDYEGDIATYRLYVVNHEVGHALGHGHEQCPGDGELAPVMQQQTLGLDGCVKNAWPYP
jgi:predicted Zn-dependent protease